MLQSTDPLLLSGGGEHDSEYPRNHSSNADAGDPIEGSGRSTSGTASGSGCESAEHRVYLQTIIKVWFVPSSDRV